MNNETVIKLKDVHKSYFLGNGEEIEILKGITTEIKKGEFVSIMGESGGGKSTLLNIIGCLHPLSHGEYIFENEDISKAKDDYTLAYIRNFKIGFIFQSFNLISRLSALKNVALPGLYAELGRKERIEKAKKILTDVGLTDRMHHKPSELSGGQQQRVSIARALVNDPEIILADEPTGALDSKTGEEVMKIFTELKEKGKTIIMVTHTPEIAKYSDRIIFLRDGKVVDCDYKLANK
jgi:putative ABC transport system ATP-binding protein